MKVIRFHHAFMHVPGGSSIPLFSAGEEVKSDHPHYEEAQRCVARGIAEEVDVPEIPAEPIGATPSGNDGADESNTGASDLVDRRAELADPAAGPTFDPATIEAPSDQQSAAADDAGGAAE